MKGIKCKSCNNLQNGWCETVIDSPDTDMVRDCQYFWQMTNADRIRAMSDEEFAGELIVYREYWDDYETHVGCFDTWEDALKAEVDYLKQPVKDGDNDG